MNIQAQLCGIIILVILRLFYKKHKKLELNTSRAFIAIWDSVLVTLILDILSLVGIRFMDNIPMIIVKFVCKGYLCSLCWCTLMAFRYICVDIFRKREDVKIWINRVYFTGTVIIILLYLLPISIYTNASKVYTYGPSVIATYIITITLMAAVFHMIIRYKKQINHRRREGVAMWMVVWLCAAIVQFINNELLIVGFASAVGVLIIYLILENPETNLDKDTGVFNLNAFFAYASQMQDMNKDISLVSVVYDSNRNGALAFENEIEIMDEIVEFMEAIPRAQVFRSSATEYILVFDNLEDAKSAIDRVQKRFRVPWGEVSRRMISVDWYLLETTEIVERAVDLLQIFQYTRQSRGELGNIHGVVIDNSLVAKIYDERHMENEIIAAMSEDRVEVFYQPIYSIKDKIFTTAEALVRIRDVDGGLIPPGKFIPVAEKRGLIIELGEIVFRKVCEFIRHENPIQYGLQYIEVNLSMVQCGYENLAEDFIRIMEESRVDPKKIVLEITESASMKEKKILLENMKKLREVGVRFALDDFGTGQSNLNYIVEMPVDVVKFDSTMINAYFENGTAKYVMDAAMNMIQGMDLAIVSEGIEEKEQYKTMKQLGIDYIQGYYFSKPVETSQFIDFIKEKSNQ